MKLRGWSVATSWTVTVLWCVVSVGVSITSLVALALPTWFIRPNPPAASFGVWWWSGPGRIQWVDETKYEIPPPAQHQDHWLQELALPYVVSAQDNLHESEMSSDPYRVAVTDNFFQVRWSITGGASIWIIVGALYGGAAVVLASTGLAGPLMIPILKPKARSSFTRLLSNMQAAAVSVQLLSLVLYPLGLGSEFARQVCGEEHTTIYSCGDCSLGYGYFLAIVSTTVAAYCPVLARLITYRDYSPYWSSVNYL
ncbi:uncharacterized protein LOC108667846 [Hyalella azteca]|uniref:Uncharacterized protein LOC108667846 n=1 Tax=Hyalella azteca TaxID=294128 RepID=A0A8B7NA19_HYAAZ|nr:uncharacterized protein LOC108667846 [Hyalella azteca]